MENKELKNQNIEELQGLLKRLLSDKENKVDYIADADQLEAIYDVGTKTYKLQLIDAKKEDKTGNTLFEISNICHRQIAQKTQIPQQFYDRLQEKYPDLLLNNINRLLHSNGKVMVRTLYGRARALLSNRYQPIDNYDVMSCVLKNLNVIAERDNINIKIMESRVTDTNFYLKVYSPDFMGYVNKDGLSPDKVHGGIIISNSEVGYGRFSVKLFIAVIRCNNGLISEKGVSRVHLGSAKEDQVIQWSDRTIELDDATLFSKLDDLIRTAFDRDLFNHWIDDLNAEAGVPVLKPIVAIQNVQRDYGIPKELTEQLLVKFTNFGLTKWGLSQTVTEYAHEQPDYDKQIELEKAGNDIMNKDIEAIIKEG